MTEAPPIGDRFRRLARLQAIYFIASGILPLVSMRGFEAITGPKTDRWLVKTAGLLVAVIGGTLGVASRRGRVTPEVVLLAAGSAGAVAAIDIVYVAKRRISPVYLVDAVAEVGFVAGWIDLVRRASVRDGTRY